MVGRLGGSDIQAFIDVIDEVGHNALHFFEEWADLPPFFDQVLNSLDLTSRVRKKCVKSLYMMCARHSLLPSSAQIEPHYDPTGVPHSRGGFADVWKGEWCGLEVAVKVLRTHANSNLQRIMRVSLWLWSWFPCAC